MIKSDYKSKATAVKIILPRYDLSKRGNVFISVTLRCVCVGIVAVEKQ